MYVLTRTGYPHFTLNCIEQALTNPYSHFAEMNQAMGYVPQSMRGRAYITLSQLAGLLEELYQERSYSYWLRPAKAGRTLIKQARTQESALWQALLVLPAYRRYLEYELLWLLLSNQQRNAGLGSQVQRLINNTYPAFSSRAEGLCNQLSLLGQPLEIIRKRLAPEFSFEKIAPGALSDLATAQGLLSGKSDLTRASEIASVLAKSATTPLYIDIAWLRKGQILTLLLLAAARQHERGVIISQGQPTRLAQVVAELQGAGLDIRIEQRGALQIAALVSPVSLHTNDWTIFRLRARERNSLDPIQAISDDETLYALEEATWEGIRATINVGIDGQSRGNMALDELGQVFSQRMSNGPGEFSGHSAVDEMLPIPSTLTIGSSLPLASDLPRLDRSYRFFDEAVEVQQRQTTPSTAILLSLWLLRQQEVPELLLAIHPHLALLYLIVADTGTQAELLKWHEERWYLEGKPLILALDDRLRALGYEVWDEGYAGHDDLIHTFGQSLVEQGLRSGVLEPGEAGPASLEAPSSYGYYEASVLLVPPTTGGSVR